MQRKSEVSEVQITVIKPQNGLVGFGSFLLDGKLYLSSVGIHTKLNGSGYRITYPTKKVGEQNIQIFHPTTQELGQEIETAVLTRFKEVTESRNDRHDNYHTG